MAIDVALNVTDNGTVARENAALRTVEQNVRKIVTAEQILQRIRSRGGDVSAAQARKQESFSIRMAKSINTTSIQYRKMREELRKLGAGEQFIKKLEQSFA